MKDKLINKKYIVLGLTVISLIGLIGIGISYAWWRYTVIQDNPNTALSKCFSLELANQTNEINLTNMYPISDEEGHSLTPFTFTLKNTCSMSAKYTLNMEMLEGTTLNSKYIDVLVNNGSIKLLSSYDTATTVIDGSTESRILDTGALQANSSKDYSISIWMDKDVTLADDSQNKVFKSKIVVDAVAIETALDKIIAFVDTTGKCPTINDDGTVQATSAESTNGYLCSAEDAYGTSYYYRGNVTNNYVKFGKWSDSATDVIYGYADESSTSYKKYSSMDECQNATSYNYRCTVISGNNSPMYWRIIRVNGDGTIRMIYDGTSAHTNNEKSDDRLVGFLDYNYFWKRNNVEENPTVSISNDNAAVGYMYGNRDTIVEPTEYRWSRDFLNTTTYYIAKEYTFDENTRMFTLKDPIQILGEDLTSDYVGYYYDNYNPINIPSSQNSLYKIMEVTPGDTSASVKNGYVGYLTSSKEVTQTNTNDSSIKTYLDNWYKINIWGTENEQYLADNIFCNDRSFNSKNTGTGAGNSETYYRWYADNQPNYRTTLKCPQQNDAFTVSDTTNGNGALTYPIVLITADEVAMAGGSYSNKNYYLYSGSNYWTMSSRDFHNNSAAEIYVGAYGSIWNSTYYSNCYVRPVINIKPEALKMCDGSMNDPYRVE